MLSSKLTKSAPITSLHTMSPADKALERSRAVRRVLGGLLVANIAVLITKAAIGARGLPIAGAAPKERVNAYPYGEQKSGGLGALEIDEYLSKMCLDLGH